MGIGDGKQVLIVGAGLAGSLMAVYLAKLGYSVQVIERRSDPRAAGFVGGRSINLALSVRGIEGLKGAGLDQLVLTNDALPMRGRMVHKPSGEIAFQAYSSNAGDAINSVSRSGLNLTLIEAAAAMPNVRFTFDQTCTDIDFSKPAATFKNAVSGAEYRVEADLIIGADGAFSAVRGVMEKIDRFDYQQSYLAHAYKELSIPPAAELPPGTVNPQRYHGFALDPAALHIWPRGGAMMIALPNRDKSFTCTLFWPLDGEHGFNSFKTPDDVRFFFKQHYPDAVPLMPTLAEDFMRNKASSLVTVRCFPWQVGGKVVLLGDAAHAIVPFFGQGMNCAFEDCRILADLLAKSPSNQAAALEEFQRTRKPNTDAIADMALDNFIEMRDTVGGRAFRWKKKAEHALHDFFPDFFLPLYNMVSFSNIPYATARERGRRQGWALRALLGVLLAMVIAIILAILQMQAGFALLVALVCGFVLADRLLSSLEPRFHD